MQGMRGRGGGGGGGRGCFGVEPLLAWASATNARIPVKIRLTFLEFLRFQSCVRGHKLEETFHSAELIWPVGYKTVGRKTVGRKTNLYL